MSKKLLMAEMITSGKLNRFVDPKGDIMPQSIEVKLKIFFQSSGDFSEFLIKRKDKKDIVNNKKLANVILKRLTELGIQTIDL